MSNVCDSRLRFFLQGRELSGKARLPAAAICKAAHAQHVHPLLHGGERSHAACGRGLEDMHVVVGERVNGIRRRSLRTVRYASSRRDVS